MKKTLFLLPLLVVTGCGTPREQCIADANRDVATLERLIVVTQTNIQRGFALVEVEDVRIQRRTCRDERRNGTSVRRRCDRLRTVTRTEPVTINLAEERIKLVQLQERRAALAQAVNPRIQQCVATYPE